MVINRDLQITLSVTYNYEMILANNIICGECNLSAVYVTGNF